MKVFIYVVTWTLALVAWSIAIDVMIGYLHQRSSRVQRR